MTDRSTLARWSRAAGADLYLRPLVARGALTSGGAVVVGLNPATAIGPNDVSFDAYLDLLQDMEAFTDFYRELRIKRGKRPISPTRRGLDGMARWLSSSGFPSVVETNVSPYPTEKGEELDDVPRSLQARYVLPELLAALAPRVVLLHGESALAAVASMPIFAGLNLHPRQSFTVLVTHRPHLGHIRRQDGTLCDVFVCPHLRFFGHEGGTRFAALRNSLREQFPSGS